VSIGERLVEGRLEAGLTTAQVAESTRIRRTLIEAIEADDYRLCGGDVYARGHIGTIARTVGLDPAPLLAEFDAAHLETAPQAMAAFETVNNSRAERRSPNWVAAMAVALLLVVGLGAWQLVRQPDKPRETTTGVVPSVAETPSASATVTPSPSTPAPDPSSSDIAELPTDGVSVTVAAVGGRSWIAVTAGSKQVFQGILEDGQSKSFSDDLKVKLVIGNAGAVRLKVNGSNLGAPGSTGQVARLTFGPGDPTAAG
jgi:cytoskeleton protein RodZ